MKKNIVKNIPNALTIIRLLSSFISPFLFINGNIMACISLYSLGIITDCLDGYVARKYDAVSELGRKLDAISDKLYFLSLIIILLIYKYYLMVIPLIIELIISVINYLILKKNKKVFTERVGKFKTTLLIIDLILGIISIKIKEIIYPHIIILLLVLYFEFQTVFAYINQLNNKSKEKIVSFKGKNVIERIKLLLEEFIYYIKKPITIK